MEFSDRLRGARLEGVGDGDDRGGLAVDGRKDRRLAVGRQGVGGGDQGRDIDALGLEEAGPADEDPATRDGGGDPAAGRGQEVGRDRQAERAGLGRLADDGVGEGMLGRPLGGGDQGEEVVLVRGARQRGRRR